MAKSRKQKAAARKRAQIQGSRTRDARTKTEMHTSRVDAKYGDGLMLAPQPKPQRVAPSAAKARIARTTTTDRVDSRVSTVRRALDILASGGMTLLFDPKRAR